MVSISLNPLIVNKRILSNINASLDVILQLLGDLIPDLFWILNFSFSCLQMLDCHSFQFLVHQLQGFLEHNMHSDMMMMTMMMTESP